MRQWNGIDADVANLGIIRVGGLLRWDCTTFLIDLIIY
jgi:hypothetical protein